MTFKFFAIKLVAGVPAYCCSPAASRNAAEIQYAKFVRRFAQNFLQTVFTRLHPMARS
jgi:hypothetical protein